MAKAQPIKSALEHFAPHAAKPQPVGPIRVRATRTGYYGHSLRNVGDEFTIQSEKEFGSWMARIEGEASTEPSAPAIGGLPVPSAPADTNRSTDTDVL